MMKFPKRIVSSLALSLACALTAAQIFAEAPAKLVVKQGDHISIIGNGLADRMQHSGYLETLIYKAFPNENLTIRNLGFSGDEVNIANRFRSENFGEPDVWLAKTKTDVLFAFFGNNEAFKGQQGLDKFKEELTAFIANAQKQYYNGNSQARLVLFSPILAEKISDPNYPNPTAHNANIRLYAQAMAEVAKANNVQFVDLIAASENILKDEAKDLTINTIHLTDEGYKELAPAIFKGTFGQEAPKLDESTEKLRKAVVDKAAMWFSRYRTVDGYNVYGGRSLMTYPNVLDNNNKIQNQMVMQQEMTQRDVMTANREKRVWAIAQGGDLDVKDDDLPPVTDAGTNKPGTLPDKRHVFLSGEEAIKHMKAPAGVKINLWADEAQFPELIKPVQMAWDTKGRLWVSAWRTYPERTPTDKVGDSILIFEDTKGTGKADKVTHFLDGLNCPTGFTFYKDGILLMQAPDLWYVRSSKGDDKGDVIERVLGGLDSADSHHTTNAMVLDPGGATYLSDGVFHRTQTETLHGPNRNRDGAIYRYEPRTGKFETYVSYNFANPHGKVFDYWGNDFLTDATGNNTYFGPAFSGHIDFELGKHPGMNQYWDRPSRPCPGTGMISSRAWPAEFNRNYLNCNVIGFQGIFRVKNTPLDSGIKGETLEHLVSSDDQNFRPAQVNTGPDGAVYFSDWSNAIIGHLQHHLRDLNRDHTHGRIYRMTYEGNTMTPAKIYGQPVAALLDLLKEPEDDTRNRAKIELGKHPSTEVVAAVAKWAAALDKNDAEYQHNMTEALWVHQWHNMVNQPLLETMLRSPDYNARAAATRVLCYWRDQVKNPLALLKVQVNDESPRVRLEAVRALSFFGPGDAKEAILTTYDAMAYQPMDYYLKYTFDETLRQLQSLTNETVLPTNPKILMAQLATMSDKQLGKSGLSELVLMEKLQRPSIAVVSRLEALNKLAEIHKLSAEAEFVKVLKEMETRGTKGSVAAESLTQVLGSLKVADMSKSRAELLSLATSTQAAGIRRSAWTTIAYIDNKAAATWADAKNDSAKAAIARSIPAITDGDLREAFLPMLTATLKDSNSSPELISGVLAALPLMGKSHNKASFALIAEQLKSDANRTSAAQALVNLPKDSWNAADAPELVQSITEWAKKVPQGERTKQEFVEVTQAGMELASLLPAADAKKHRKELRSLGVSVFVVKTVREQMRYDVTRLVVETGKPFQIIVENGDMMPHNLVVLNEGTTRDSVIKITVGMSPEKKDNQGRPYMPDAKKMINATGAIEAGQKATLQMKGIAKEGTYEYMCTFPEHGMMMFGTLIVTKDVDTYYEKNPIAPVQPAMEHKH